MTDAQFLTAINLIASKHNMKYEIDFEAQTVLFVGDKENEKACALELEKILGEYAT